MLLHTFLAGEGTLTLDAAYTVTQWAPRSLPGVRTTHYSSSSSLPETETSGSQKGSEKNESQRQVKNERSWKQKLSVQLGGGHTCEVIASMHFVKFILKQILLLMIVNQF